VLFLLLAVIVLTAVLVAFSFMMLGSPAGVGETQVKITEQQAIQTGRFFLDSRGCTTGNVLSVELEELNHLPEYTYFYWHELFGLEKPDIQNTDLTWVVSFEQAKRAGHCFEVCIDANTGVVVGGSQCR
jgi:hypothetical protein